MVVVISDTHFGRKTKKFNHKEGQRCMLKITSSVLKSFDTIRHAFNVDEISIFLIGDIIDGEEIFPGHGYAVEFNIDRQKQVAMESINEMVKTLQPFFKRINIHCVKGNHGIANRRASEKSNWDLALYRELQAYYRSEPTVRVVVAESWHHTVNIEGHRILLCHGDEIKPSGDTPYTSIAKRVMRWVTSNMFGRIDMVVLGHLHTDYKIRAGSIPIIGNGCFVKDDEYSIKFGFTPSRIMHILGVTKEKLPTYIHEIDLDED